MSLVLSVAAAAAGCSGEINNIPTTPDPVIVTETFTGTLTVNGAATHNVFTSATGAVTATAHLARRERAGEGRIQHGHAVAVGNCTVVVSNDNAVVDQQPGRHRGDAWPAACACGCYDVGALTEPVAYTITVNHP